MFDLLWGNWGWCCDVDLSLPDTSFGRGCDAMFLVPQRGNMFGSNGRGMGCWWPPSFIKAVLMSGSAFCPFRGIVREIPGLLSANFDANMSAGSDALFVPCEWSIKPWAPVWQLFYFTNKDWSFNKCVNRTRIINEKLRIHNCFQPWTLNMNLLRRR